MRGVACGLVYQADDPYTPFSPLSLAMSLHRHVQHLDVLPTRCSVGDNALGKQTIMDHGTVVAYLHWDDGAYNFTAQTAVYLLATQHDGAGDDAFIATGRAGGNGGTSAISPTRRFPP